MIRPGPGDAHGLPPDYDALRRLDATWDDWWSLSWDGLPVDHAEAVRRWDDATQLSDEDIAGWDDLPTYEEEE